MNRSASVWTPYLLLSPFLLTVAVFIAYPLVQSVVLAMQQTYGPTFTHFVYGENFTRLFDDPLFWLATRNTFVFAGASLFIQFPLALAIANLRDVYAQDFSMLTTATVVSVAPVIALFLFLQKEYVEGLTSGAVKG
jgi:multiple sugar transport system permease protein